MLPHDTSGPLDQSSQNLGNKCQLVRPRAIFRHPVTKSVWDICCQKFVLQKKWPSSRKQEMTFDTNAPHYARFPRARSCGVQEKCYNFFSPFTILVPQGVPLCQSSPVWVMTYSKAPSVKLPNFVPFCWKSLFRISAVKVRQFCWWRDQHTHTHTHTQIQTVNDIVSTSPCGDN